MGKGIAAVLHLIDADTQQPVTSPVRQVLRDRIITGLANHTLLIAQDGTARPIEASGAPIIDRSGQLLGVVLVVRDITERVQAEQERARLLAGERAARAAAEAAVRVRDQFVSVAAHELKTPLSTLMGQVQLFQRRAERERHLLERDQRTLQIISDQVARLNKRVSLLLDISRLRIAATPTINVLTRTEVAALDGDDMLRQITLTDCITGQSRTVASSWLFVCIGGEPQTHWASEVGIVRDTGGYLVTGPDLVRNGRCPAQRPLDREPYYLETSMAGLFAAGDVRHGSIKRCASAVGEGAMAVALVHRYLAAG